MTEIAALQQSLWGDILASGNLTPNEALQSAFFAAPRHRFIGRYRTHQKTEWRHGPIEEIYTDVALVLADHPIEGVLSTCSMPSYILDLVRWLDVQPGHSVLEVGSGCGWLVAMLSRLVGPEGRVTGIELLQELAEASRENLAGYDVTIHCGDGRAGYPARAPFDRVIFTAGASEPPAALRAQMAPGGLLLVPVLVGEGTRAVVHLFEAVPDGFIQRAERPGFFVPLRQ